MITLRSKVFDILKDGAWHSPYDMAQQLDTTAKAVSSRIRDLRLPEYGNYRIKAKRIEGNIFEYQMVNPPKPKPTIWSGISGGVGGTGGSTGGWITITSGTSTGFGSGGSVTITGGAGGTTSGNGGSVTIRGGTSTIGSGGTVTLTGGTSSGYNYSAYVAPYMSTFSLPVRAETANTSGWSRNYESLYNYKHNYEPLI